MKKYFWKKIAKSIARIAAALAIILGISALCYWVWQPGSDEPLPQYTNNAVWLGHGWLGDNDWFERNKRKKMIFQATH